MREFANYCRHEKWLETHFGNSYIQAREGSWILTEIVDMLGGADPDSMGFPSRAKVAIEALTKPDDVYGHIVAFRPSHKTYDFKVPAELVTVEVVRKHAQYIRELRDGGKRHASGPKGV
jgi:hypothetical protein